MSESREAAHQAMLALWQAADARLHQPDVAEQVLEGAPFREFDSERGAQLSSIGRQVFVCTDLKRPDGTEERTEVHFPDDMHDLAKTPKVYVEWMNDSDAGSSIPPMRDFPQIAERLTGLI